MSIGHSPDESQWTPDMPKDQKDITEADKREAKRRIQGSVSAPESPENSGDDKPADRPRSPGLLSPNVP
jgi:phosphatidylserine decarboxylase